MSYPNRSTVLALLASSDLAVERGIVALYRRQTVGEQHTSSTTDSNGRGFNYHHAERGSYWARWVISGRRLTGTHLAGARQMCRYYVRQLVEMAQETYNKRQGQEPVHKLSGVERMYVHIMMNDAFQRNPRATHIDLRGMRITPQRIDDTILPYFLRNPPTYGTL
jgi:hypothetical protein